MVLAQPAPGRTEVTLDAEQRAVAAHCGGPMLVLAGPGTGKTTTLVEAVLARLRGVGHEPIPASRVLVLTFGRKAAAEIRQRLAGRIGSGLLPPVATFHSFAYGLIRQAAARPDVVAAERLLTAPEQEHRLREIFGNAVREGRVDWPTDLAAALGTDGLARALREWISRARTLGMSGEQLRRAAKSGPAVWSGLATFLTEYLDVLDAEGVLDYVEVINRAAEVVGRQAEPMFDAVYVDEYQDTDPAQVRLLKRLVVPQTTLVAVGDPDQAIYSFRGADVRGVLGFRTDFPGPGGSEAALTVLCHSRRFGHAIQAGAGRVIQRVSLAGLPAAVQRDHRNPKVRGDPAPRKADSAVAVVTFASQAEHSVGVAEAVRQVRYSGVVDRWSRIAVIVRSAVRDIGPLRSSLVAAGVPVAVAGDELPLRDEPALRPILTLLRSAAGVDELTGSVAVALAQSRLGGISPEGVRVLGRALRNAAINNRASITGSGELLAAMIMNRGGAEPAWDESDAGPVGLQLRALANLHERTRRQINAGAPVPEVLWSVWNHRGEPDRLRSVSLAGGVAGEAADRALDAAIALFKLADRIDDPLSGARGMRAFLHEVASQQIPGGSGNQSGATPQRDCVQLLTAHRAKGLEWDVVVVAGAQEESWPDLRHRPSLLETDRLTEWITGRPRGNGDLLADERRLFYVACTRARERLIVTCVASPDDSGPQPSRFVGELAAGAAVAPVSRQTVGAFGSSLIGTVARLRAALEDPDTSSLLRAAARARLAELAEALPSHQAVLADPTRWWGKRAWTVAPQALVAMDEPVTVSGSMWSALDACPFGWFLTRHARVDGPTGSAPAFGSVVHALADAVARGEVAAEPAALERSVRQFWPMLTFEAQWQSDAELDEAIGALRRFAQWHANRPDRELVGSEVEFVTELETPAGVARVRGRIDRLERGPAGLHVVDLKTQRRAPSASDVAGHRQLTLYQLVASTGSLRVHSGEPASDPPPVAGAELVQLRIGDNKTDGPRVQTQSQVAPADVLLDLSEVVNRVRAEEFAPVAGPGCRSCSIDVLCPLVPAGREVGQ